MKHYSCDLCGKQLSRSEDLRFIVRLEAFAAHDPKEITEADLDEDHLEQVSQLLQDLEDGDDVPVEELGTKSFQYDLCSDCHRKFLRDPLGKEALQKLSFSKN